MNSVQPNLFGRRVLVTGGTGSIGGRLVERLVLQCKANVRVLVRDFARAVPISRFSVEVFQGDVTKPEDVERAIRGCEIVFHCAYGNSGSDELRRLVNVEGSRNVMEAALHAKVRRIVHLSTVMVYGVTPDVYLDESAPRRSTDIEYSESKLDAEKIALKYVERHGLPVVILQPTAVYGPFAQVWTVDVLKRLKTGRVILVNGGNGIRNAVYIDDVVTAILLAAVKEKVVGEAFLISSEKPVTWREFYGRYERMLGISATVSMSVAEALAYYSNKRGRIGVLREALTILREEPHIRERVLETSAGYGLRKLSRLLVPKQIRRTLKKRIMDNSRTAQIQIAPQEEKSIYPLPPSLVQYNAAKTAVRIDKAKRMLDYQPAYDFESGMRVTEQWARWANLL